MPGLLVRGREGVDDVPAAKRALGRIAPDERVGCVIDVETVPDADVVALAPAGAVAGRSRRAMHRVVCATLLSFAERPEHGELRCLDMRTVTLERMEEGPLLGTVDTLLPDPEDGRSILVTFAGAMHDMVVLRQRAMRLWMFDMPRVRGWAERRANHHDLMYAFGSRPPYPSLAEVCALIGADLGVSRSDEAATRWIERGDWLPMVRRNQGDVAATFLAYAYLSAWRRGCERPVATGWTSLAEMILRQGDATHHLRGFSRHHMVGFAAKRLEALAEAGSCRCDAAPAAAIS